MTIIEAIIRRTSIRTYTGTPLKDSDKNAILQFINELQQPFNGKARIELISKHSEDKSIKLGTYGVISGANDFLALIYKEGNLAEQNAAYMFEQVILFCTSLELGTCWIGGTYKRDDFFKQIDLKEDETLRIISPVGYPSKRESLVSNVMKIGAKSRSRKQFEKLFFINDFETPAKTDEIGKYLEPLEMLRIAPSARNIQPWRAIIDKNNIHFYDSINERFSPIDLGIGLCHFGETCKEFNIEGKFEVLDSAMIPAKEKMKYVISWLG